MRAGISSERSSSNRSGIRLFQPACCFLSCASSRLRRCGRAAGRNLFAAKFEQQIRHHAFQPACCFAIARPRACGAAVARPGRSLRCEVRATDRHHAFQPACCLPDCAYSRLRRCGRAAGRIPSCEVRARSGISAPVSCLLPPRMRRLVGERDPQQFKPDGGHVLRSAGSRPSSARRGVETAGFVIRNASPQALARLRTRKM